MKKGMVGGVLYVLAYSLVSALRGRNGKSEGVKIEYGVPRVPGVPDENEKGFSLFAVPRFLFGSLLKLYDAVDSILRGGR